MLQDFDHDARRSLQTHRLLDSDPRRHCPTLSVLLILRVLGLPLDYHRIGIASQ
jgi:hypothetical protein